MRIRIDNNHQWQERFLAAALIRDAGLLKQWIESPELLWAQEYEELYQHNKEQIASMMKVLLPTLTKKQKRHAAERVLGWIDKMEGTL